MSSIGLSTSSNNRGSWRVTVELNDGRLVHAWAEFCDADVPKKIVMTRRFDSNSHFGERETTVTYRFDSSGAACGNAELLDKVLGWLAGYISPKT